METFPSQATYDMPQEMTQPPYFPSQNVSHYGGILPPTPVASFDRSIRAAQEASWTGSSGVSFTQAPAMPPVVQQMDLHGVLPRTPLSPGLQQPLPIPPQAPVLTRYWVPVPQRIYNLGRKQWDYSHSEAILFGMKAFPGINLHDALQKRFTGLIGRDDQVFRNTAGAISCRFLFPGYPANRSTQISTLDWTKDRRPITRSKLAYEVAKQLDRYLKSMADRPMDRTVDDWWKIGEGFMRLERMFLVRLVPVSKGSFQPEIWIFV